VNLTVVHGCRVAPPFRASPCSSEVLRRSPPPSFTSLFKESSRGGRNRRHHRGYLAGNELLRHQNSSSPATLRPNQHHQRVPGELLVRPHPFPLLLPRRSARHGRPLPASGSRSGWAICPSRPWPAKVALGPSGQWLRVVLTPGVKSSATRF
jgi:hypothetical protein